MLATLQLAQVGSCSSRLLVFLNLNKSTINLPKWVRAWQLDFAWEGCCEGSRQVHRARTRNLKMRLGEQFEKVLECNSHKLRRRTDWLTTWRECLSPECVPFAWGSPFAGVTLIRRTWTCNGTNIKIPQSLAGWLCCLAELTGCELFTPQ